MDRYGYVNNNPLRYVDPSGHGCEEIPEGSYARQQCERTQPQQPQPNSPQQSGKPSDADLAIPAPTRDDDAASLSGGEDSPSVCQFDASGFTCTLTLSSDQIDQWLQTIRFLKWLETGIIAFDFALMVAPAFLAGPEVGLAAEALAAGGAAFISAYESDQWDKVVDELKEVPRGEGAVFTLSSGWGAFAPFTFDNGMGSRSEPITFSLAATFLALRYFDFPVLGP